MIVGPIVVQDRDGCLAIYESVDEAIANLDYDDVVDHEYTAYDSRGRLLAISAAAEPIAVATIEPIDDRPRHEDELRAALRYAIRARAPKLAAAVADMPLSALIDHALRLKRGFFLP